MKTVDKPVVATVYLCDKCGKEFALKGVCKRHESSCDYAPPDPLYKAGEWVSLQGNTVGGIVSVDYDPALLCYHYRVRPLFFEPGEVVGMPDDEDDHRTVVEEDIAGVLDKDQVNAAIAVLEGPKTAQDDKPVTEEIGILGGCDHCLGVVIGIERYIYLDVKKRTRVTRVVW